MLINQEMASEHGVECCDEEPGALKIDEDWERDTGEEEETEEEEEEDERDADLTSMLAVDITEQDYPLDLSISPRIPVQQSQLRIRQDLHLKASVPRPQLKVRSDLTAVSRQGGPPLSAGGPHLHRTPTDQKWSLTATDLGRLILPYLTAAGRNNKISCTVCGMKFPNLVKGLNHVENKHVDCLQYRCSLCKSIKNSRLAFDCHLRSRHSVGGGSDRPDGIAPLCRLKRPFSIKVERTTKSKGSRQQRQQPLKKKQQRQQQRQHQELAAHQQQQDDQRNGSYDLQFVTFLRAELASDAAMEEAELAVATSWHWATPSQGPAHLAEWLHKEQGIFRINRRQEFAKKWYQFKEKSEGSWERLLTEVLSTFVEKHLFKLLSPDLPIYQVYCIRQLLK